MEKWEAYYTREQLNRLQEIELENLRVFIDVCRQLDLEYFVYGGTLLGVEKYRGLIPWDDDIDVAMPRKSYEKFCELGAGCLPDGYLLQTPYNCPESPYPYAKLRKTGTRYVEYLHRNLRYDMGIYIDIYPVDRIPDDETLRRKQYKRVQRWIFLYVCRQSRPYDKKETGLTGLIRHFGKLAVCHCARLLPQRYCMRKIDRYMTRYDDTDTKRYAALNSPNYDNIYLQLYPLQKGEFEGMEVNIPGDHKTHLTMRYGDYSGLPKEEDRVGHIPYILDFGENASGE